MEDAEGIKVKDHFWVDLGLYGRQRCERCGTERATWNEREYVYYNQFGSIPQWDWGFNEPDCNEAAMRRALG
jgi:hypothetical protein